MHDGRVRHLLFYWTIYMAPPKHVIHFSTRPYARTSFFLRHFMHLMDSRRYRDDRTWRERWVMTCKKGPWPDTILGCCTSYGWRRFKYFFWGGVIMRSWEGWKPLLVSRFMGDGECQAQARVLIDGAASVLAAHPADRSETCKTSETMCFTPELFYQL